jgi:hypothetical protein
LILKRVKFDKSFFITPAELDAIAAKYIGTKVDLAALQRLVQDVKASILDHTIAAVRRPLAMVLVAAVAVAITSGGG